ncbi:MAG: hypothetical protein SGI77_15540 [Pirellulaceae bacterium]|nr:hypothetical protein [Pirellulaceae bacterium]
MSTFSESLEQFRQSRSAIASYCVRIESLTFLSDDFKQSLVAGASPNVDTTNFLLRSTFEIACDQANDRWLAIQYTEPFLPELAFAGSLNVGSSINVYLIDGAVAFKLAGRKFVELPSLIAVPVPDPLTLGGGFCHEMANFVPQSKMFSNLSSWNRAYKNWTVESAGSIVTFRQPLAMDPKLSPLSISFDAQKDSHPVAIRVGEMRSKGFFHSVEADVKLRKVDGYWMPRYVSYACNENTVKTFFLEWFSINQPLPEGLFDKDLLLSLLGIE